MNDPRGREVFLRLVEQAARPGGETDVDRDGRDEVDTPCGGYKQSGVGRENGELGFEEYLDTKVSALPRA